MEEYMKQQKIYQKKYREDNKERLKQHRQSNNNKYTCELCKFNTYNLTMYNVHLNRKKHLKNVENK